MLPGHPLPLPRQRGSRQRAAPAVCGFVLDQRARQTRDMNPTYLGGYPVVITAITNATTARHTYVCKS